MRTKKAQDELLQANLDMFKQGQELRLQSLEKISKKLDKVKKDA